MANHLLHPDFVGAYVYQIIVSGIVRYIGKGRRYRAIEHFRIARTLNRRRANGERVRAYPFHNKLAKAMRNGAKVRYKILAKGLSDDIAYAREVAEMEMIPEGQLWNLRTGGTGGDREMMLRLWMDLDYRARVLAAQAASHGTEEYRELARRNAEVQWSDPEFRARWLAQHRSLWDDPERAAERRTLLKKVWSDPEKSRRKSELVKSQWTPERRAAMAENRRRAWADPEFKAKAAASIRKSKIKRVGPEQSLPLHSAKLEEV